MTFHWPQLILLCLQSAILLGGFMAHGLPRAGKVNGFSFLIEFLVIDFILYFGGFFK